MERGTLPQGTLVSPVPAPTPEELGRRRLSVRIDSGRPGAVVERRVTTAESAGAFIVLPFKYTDTTWEQVCVSPCVTDLDRFSTYRVRAQNGISVSKPFTLPQDKDVLHLKLRTGSLVAHRGGEILTGIGLAAVIVGGALLITASDFRHPDDERAAGGITLGGGVVFAAVGLPLAIATTTRVRQESNEEIAKTYWNKGRDVPFLPNIKLAEGVTLTQRGIVF